MARSEARIFTAVWKDKHFLALPLSAQWLYFFLVSQPDLTHCGVMPLRVRRWASKAEGLTEAQIRADLIRLAEAKPNPFIVIDEESEELFVRALMRRDKVLRQPFLFVPAAEAIENVESPRIQAALLAELRRALAEGDVNDKVCEQVKTLIHTLGERVQETHTDTHSDSHSDTLPESVPESHSETQPGIGGGYGPAVEASPIPGIPFVPPPAGAASPSRDDEVTTRTIVGEWIDRCKKRPPNNVIGQISKQIKTLLDEGIHPDDIRRGLAEWMTKNVHPSVLPSLVNGVMNTITTSRESPARSTTDERVAQAQSLKERLRAGDIPQMIQGEIAR